MKLDAALLRAATGCSADAAERFAGPLEAACAFYGIDTPARLAAFLAQVGHESDSFRYTSEVWGPTLAQLRYEGRQDLGNTQPGDGYRFRGHGLIQVTGRFNHARVRDRLRERFDGAPDFEADPEALCSPKWAALSAADYWDDRGLNALADSGDFERITRRINGGLKGHADRLARWKRAREALEAAQVEPPTVETTMPVPEPAQPAPRGWKSDPIPLDPINPSYQGGAMSPFIAAALPAIIDAVPSLARIFSSGSQVAERNVKAAEVVVGIAKEAVAAHNEQELVEVLRNDPSAAKAVQMAVAQHWFEISEAGGGGIGGARAHNAALAEKGWRVSIANPAMWISIVLLAMPFMLLADVFYVHPENYDASLRVQVITAVLAVVMMVGAYWLGTTAARGEAETKA